MKILNYEALWKVLKNKKVLVLRVRPQAKLKFIRGIKKRKVLDTNFKLDSILVYGKSYRLKIHPFQSSNNDFIIIKFTLTLQKSNLANLL